MTTPDAPRPRRPFRLVRKGGSILVTSLLMLGVLVMVNQVADRRHWRVDTTAGNVFSLSPQTRQIVAGLDTDVQLIAFLSSADPEQDRLLRLFEEYRSASRRIRCEMIDPDRRPGEAARYGIREYSLIVVAGGRQEKARTLNEEGITNALLRVRRTTPIQVAFLAGHGELSPFDRGKGGMAAAGEALSNAGYAVRRLSLLATGGVSDSVDLVVIAAPRAELLPGEAAVLSQYMERGGRLLALLDPPPAAALGQWLGAWGVRVGDDRIIDPNPRARLVGLDAVTPAVTRYEDSPVTRDFRVATYFRLARSIDLPEALPKGARGWILFRSGPGSWAEVDSLAIDPRLDPGRDRLGPVPMAVAVNHPETSGARLVVFGDADFASNRDWRLPGNGDLFLNAVAWLAERGDEIAVRAASTPDRRLELDARQARAIFLAGVLGLPLLVVAAGLWTGWRRRGL